MQIPCEEIEGYNKLTEAHQAIFKGTYDHHYKVMGASMREQMTPTSVRLAREKGKNYLKVTFSNGDWYHYLPGGVYY